MFGYSLRNIKAAAHFGTTSFGNHIAILKQPVVVEQEVGYLPPPVLQPSIAAAGVGMTVEQATAGRKRVRQPSTHSTCNPLLMEIPPLPAASGT